ncbi:MAG: cobalamin B12-binding domain-containing protein [Gemmobacter sp.]|jgi:MerR family transcriptional regulator, light-induced transcriptional regulator|nr:cobalamin B12-binding domain-containing protein [Gemmobacter sp.]
MDRFRQKELLRLAPGEFGIAQLALHVVAIMVGDAPGGRQPVREDVLRLLVRGASTGDPHVFEKLAAEMRRLHISAECMVGDYIPAAVAQIGEEWHSDRIDILESTIAISRLQNLLRELGRAWSADAANPQMLGSVLMVVPDTEQHTIGAMIATTQMRRAGVSVAVQLLSSPRTLEELLRQRRFDAIFFSVGNFDSLEACRKLVTAARGVVGTSVRFAVGGAVPADLDDLRRITGADFATRDVCVALRDLGLMKTAAPVV